MKSREFWDKITFVVRRAVYDDNLLPQKVWDSYVENWNKYVEHTIPGQYVLTNVTFLSIDGEHVANQLNPTL